MKTPIRIHPDALAEMEATVEWYRARSHRAAADFLFALRFAMNQISTDPLRFPAYSPGTRRMVLRRFPYLIVFHWTESEINVIAVAHGRRKPGYWRDRIR
jgi:plasmid stabilization system protein ParE